MWAWEGRVSRQQVHRPGVRSVSAAQEAARSAVAGAEGTVIGNGLRECGHTWAGLACSPETL